MSEQEMSPEQRKFEEAKSELEPFEVDIIRHKIRKLLGENQNDE